jgi:TetR/AcrR family transcriptional regulator, cholesterol catabolism regulator
MDAALELFREKGYHSTSLQDIIKAADCSKGGFYHHFSSKEELLYLIHETFINYELEKGEEVKRRKETATNRLRQLIIDLVESIDMYRPHVTVFFEERRFLSSDRFVQIKKKRDQYEAIVREIVSEGIRSGEFRTDIDARIITFGLFGMCNWTYQWLRPGRGFTSHQVGEMFANLILQGLQARPEPAGELAATGGTQRS